MKPTTNLALFLVVLLLAGCAAILSVTEVGKSVARMSTQIAAATLTAEPSATLSLTAAHTQTPEPTATPLPTSTPPPVPTATWAVYESGKVTVPILLYHHVNVDEIDYDYSISTAVFAQQMQALQDWGYTVISLSKLVDVLIHGGTLPERPVVITFDDGNQNIYQNAFPIMQKHGYVGTFFIVANRLGSMGFVSTDQLKEMAAAGWDIGSHSYSHIDITKNHGDIWTEVAKSRIKLEEKLGVPVKVFAYPYGTTDPTVVQNVQDYGYRAAVGLGIQNTHTWETLYYLSRNEVRREYTLSDFAKLLPWGGG